ncbi:MAG: hypothetical protein MHMPM18_001853 [Marteilia pararefringens]
MEFCPTDNNLVCCSLRNGQICCIVLDEDILGAKSTNNYSNQTQESKSSLEGRSEEAKNGDRLNLGYRTYYSDITHSHVMGCNCVKWIPNQLKVNYDGRLLGNKNSEFSRSKELNNFYQLMSMSKDNSIYFWKFSKPESLPTFGNVDSSNKFRTIDRIYCVKLSIDQNLGICLNGQQFIFEFELKQMGEIIDEKYDREGEKEQCLTRLFIGTEVNFDFEILKSDLFE